MLNRLFILLIGIALVGSLNGQNNEEKVSEFLRLIEQEAVIKQTYNFISDNIIKETEAIFKELQFEPKDSSEFAAFESYVELKCSHYINGTKDSVRAYFLLRDEKSIDTFIHIAKTEPNRKSVFAQTGFASLVGEIIRHNSTRLSESFSGFIDDMKADRGSLKLKFIINGEEVKDLEKAEVDLMLSTNNPEYKKVDILDNGSTMIKWPEGLNIEEINHLIVKYKEAKAIFYNLRPEDSNISEELTRNIMIKSNKKQLAKDSFEKLRYWFVVVETNKDGSIKTLGIKIKSLTYQILDEKLIEDIRKKFDDK